MKIGAIRTILAGLSTSIAVSCAEKEVQQFQRAAANPETVQAIKYLNETTQMVFANATYKYFGKDTILVPLNPLKDTDIFLKRMRNSLSKKMPKAQNKKNETIDKFINSKALIKDEFFLNQENGRTYVAIELYGRENPQLK